MNKKLSGVLFIVIFKLITSSYVHNTSPSGNNVHWPEDSSVIDIYVNSSNGQGLSDAFVQNQAALSTAEWNNHSAITLRKNSTNSSADDALNEIYFSTNPEIFTGTGVIGITEVTYKNNSGEIVSADILINDNYVFSQNVNDVEFLGNVITHELGHLLGLGHSQVQGASMFYALTRGQSKVDSDDKAGLYSIYPNGDISKATLSGKIIGGNKLTGVFGAHVEAISMKTGTVDAAAISTYDGSFSITGLKKDEKYLLYTKPLADIGLPSKYKIVRNNFCESNLEYRGSFFQACDSSAEGFPQSVNLNATQVNIGNVTIRCGLDVPPEYIQTKGVTPATFDILSYSQGPANTFTGYFSNQEMSSLTANDYFRINLAGVNPDSLSLSGDLYVELKVLNQMFYTPMKVNVTVKRNSSTTTITPKYSQNADGWLNMNTVTYIPISRADQSDNNLEISIRPESMNFPFFPAGIPLTKADYLPSHDDFEDAINFYLVMTSIVKANGDGTYSTIHSKTDLLSDNTRCPDAVNTYSLTSYTTQGRAEQTNAAKKKDDDGFLGCGTIDTNQSGGNGPAGFFIGLILSLLLCSLGGKIIRPIKQVH